ncbi:HEPN domain-containing protein [Glycomyces buryatensis]|uniref:HEPN domain-containing protein n=1 Tax=Glycomyces buryatensis TaxID=2570927 RepID=A0A4S8QBS4_9ACTN|nr:HEPN domain-containing protein [Glycomyces buryatensis]
MMPSIGAGTSGGTPNIEDVLARITQADKKTLEMFAEGVSLQTRSSRVISDLKHQVCADRIRFSASFLVSANKAFNSRPGQDRSAISRYYYSMYHAARAVVYFNHGGDDHEKHSVLPGKLPDDFPRSSYWQNELKDARLNRNSADYDPYPESRSHWHPLATALGVTAPAFLQIATQYLKQKGCSHV